MKAAILNKPAPIAERPLRIEDVAQPEIAPGQVLLKVRACGVCRTDLHITEGELPQRRVPLDPRAPDRGRYCRWCDAGFAAGDARWRVVDRRHRRHLLVLQAGQGEPLRRTDVHRIHRGRRLLRNTLPLAPTSSFRCPPSSTICTPRRCCARASSAFAACGSQTCSAASASDCSASGHRRILAIEVLHAWKCEVYVSTRGESHRKLAESLGATWVGAETDKPPVELDRAVTFAPSGDVVVAALSSLRKGGVVAINAIHLDRIPQFDYDRLLWGERQLRSVANMTRADARDFLQIAAEIGMRPKVTSFRLDEANDALLAVKRDAIDGAAVIVI